MTSFDGAQRATEIDTLQVPEVAQPESGLWHDMLRMSGTPTDKLNFFLLACSLKNLQSAIFNGKIDDADEATYPIFRERVSDLIARLNTYDGREHQLEAHISLQRTALNCAVALAKGPPYLELAGDNSWETRRGLYSALKSAFHLSQEQIVASVIDDLNAVHPLAAADCLQWIARNQAHDLVSLQDLESQLKLPDWLENRICSGELGSALLTDSRFIANALSTIAGCAATDSGCSMAKLNGATARQLIEGAEFVTIELLNAQTPPNPGNPVIIADDVGTQQLENLPCYPSRDIAEEYHEAFLLASIDRRRWSQSSYEFEAKNAAQVFLNAAWSYYSRVDNFDPTGRSPLADKTVQSYRSIFDRLGVLGIEPNPLGYSLLQIFVRDSSDSEIQKFINAGQKHRQHLVSSLSRVIAEGHSFTPGVAEVFQKLAPLLHKGAPDPLRATIIEVYDCLATSPYKGRTGLIGTLLTKLTGRFYPLKWLLKVPAPHRID